MIKKSHLSARRYVALAEAAEYLGCSTRTVRRMIDRGELQGYRIGKSLVRVDMAEVQEVPRRIPNPSKG